MINLLKREISKISDVDTSKIKLSDRIENIGLDSFDMICLVNNLNEELNTEIELSEVSSLNSVEDFVSFLESKNI